MKFSTLVLVGCLGFLSGGAKAAPVGMAAQVKGTVYVVQGAQTQALPLLGRVEEGTSVTCGPNSAATIVLFRDGSRYQLGANSRATFLASGVTGAKKMADLSGPSARAVKLLGGARVGALMTRQGNSFERLDGNPAGIVTPSKSRFAWLPIEDASRYTFTLFDANDNVVWSITSNQTAANYPSDALPLVEKQPYLWKVSGFTAAGKRLITGRWGIITPLTDENARLLDTLASGLQNQAKATPDDKTPLLLLVEAYRAYGAVNRALELLEGQLSGEEGVPALKNELLDSLSPFTRVLANRGVAVVQ